MNGVAASGRTLILDVSHDRNNGVSERKQCFSCKCHVFNIYFYKFLHRSGTLAFTINFIKSPIMS